jgi:hypothetical protein
VEILNAFTEHVLAENITTLFYLGSQLYTSANIPAEQYLVKTAEFLGLPIIAWLNSNAGLFQVSSRKSTSIL